MLPSATLPEAPNGAARPQNRKACTLLRALYHKVLQLAAHPRAERWLAVIAFAESSVFPIPPDALLLPMGMAKPERAYRYALICTVASVLGGMLGYAIGYWLFDAVARPVLNAYGQADALDRFIAWYGQWGALVILIKGLTPLPYKVVTIASGAAHFNFGIFLLASLATRGLRFFLLAFLLRHFGAPMAEFIEKRLMLVTTAVAVLLVAGFLALRWL